MSEISKVEKPDSNDRKPDVNNKLLGEVQNHYAQAKSVFDRPMAGDYQLPNLTLVGEGLSESKTPNQPGVEKSATAAIESGNAGALANMPSERPIGKPNMQDSERMVKTGWEGSEGPIAKPFKPDNSTQTMANPDYGSLPKDATGPKTPSDPSPKLPELDKPSSNSQASGDAKKVQEILGKLAGKDLSKIFSSNDSSTLKLDDQIQGLLEGAAQNGTLDSVINELNAGLEKQNSDFRFNVDTQSQTVDKIQPSGIQLPPASQNQYMAPQEVYTVSVSDEKTGASTNVLQFSDNWKNGAQPE